MIFCDKCGSLMKETVDGYTCRKCGKTIPVKSKTKKLHPHRTTASGIFVIGKDRRLRRTVSKMCPACGNKEAFYSSSSISGEHAGVKQERTLERFKCAKCSYSWVESS